MKRRNRRIFLRMTARGQVRLGHLITHTVPDRDAPDTFAMVRRGGTGWLGIVFTWDASLASRGLIRPRLRTD